MPSDINEKLKRVKELYEETPIPVVTGVTFERYRELKWLANDLMREIIELRKVIEDCEFGTEGICPVCSQVVSEGHDAGCRLYRAVGETSMAKWIKEKESEEMSMVRSRGDAGDRDNGNGGRTPFSSSNL